MTDLLPTATDVKPLSKEQLGFYILEWMNDENANALKQGYAPYRAQKQNFLRDMEQSYRDEDVTNAFSSAFRWMLQEDYIADSSRATEADWYTLTAKGREVKSHEQWAKSGVAHDIPPGPAPSFGPVTTDAALSAHLKVLWEEASLSYVSGAYLATVVMLGALLEGALLATAQSNRPAAMAATNAPADKSGKVLDVEDWRLAALIEVASDLSWVHKTRGDFSDVLRNYRNLVHPWKAARTPYKIDRGTANVSWQVVKETLRDLNVSIP